MSRSLGWWHEHRARLILHRVVTILFIVLRYLVPGSMYVGSVYGRTYRVGMINRVRLPILLVVS